MSLALNIIAHSICRECTLPHVHISYQRQDQIVWMPYSPLGPPLFSYRIKGEMNSHGGKPCLTSSPLSSQSTQQLQHIQRGKALWKSVQEDERWKKEERGWFAVVEQEKGHTPPQHELFAEISNNGNNQLFLTLLMFKKKINLLLKS